MKISLCHLPPWTVEAPPVNMGYISSVLKENGFNVSSFDFNLRLYRSDIDTPENFWKGFELEELPTQTRKELNNMIKKWSKEILDEKPDVVGFTVYESSLDVCLKMANEIKNIDSSVHVVFGGPAFPHHHNLKGKELKDKTHEMENIDFVVLGEGEKTTVDLMNRIRKGRSYSDCKGIAFMEDETLKRTEKRRSITDLDKLPFPDYSGLPIKRYEDSKVGILGSRGCPNRCNFCQDTEIWDLYRCRSAEDIFEEMEMRYEQGFSNFKFYDLLLNGNMDQLRKLVKMVEKSDMDDIGIWGQFRCHKDFDRSLLKRMRKIGLESMVFGIESGSEKMLGEINKNVGIETIEKNLRDVKESGIRTGVNILIGFPGETDETVQETIEFLKENEEFIDEITSLNSLHLRRGSYLYQNPKEFNLNERDEQFRWSTEDGNTLEKRFEWMLRTYKEIEKLDIDCDFTRLQTTFTRLLKYYREKGKLETMEKRFNELLQMLVDRIESLESEKQRLYDDLNGLIGEKHET